MNIDKDPIDQALEQFANEPSKSELPSNFTHLMMQKIEQEAERKSVAKPLISPVGWIIFAGFALLIVCSFIFGDFSQMKELSLPKINFEKHADKIQLILATIFAIFALILMDSIYRRKSRKQKLN